MINPKFALAFSLVLALIVIYVGYLFFGNSVTRLFQSITASSPAVISTPAPESAAADPTAVTEAQNNQTAEQPAEIPPPVEEAPTEAAAPPPDTPVPPTEAPVEPAPTVAPVEEPSPTEVVAEEIIDNSRTVNGKYYDAYVDAATKKSQYYHYTCEFDAAWVVLKTYGIDATLQDQIDIVGLDNSVEPYYEENAEGTFIYGGDILSHYSGDYEHNFMARSTGHVIRRIFEHYGLKTTTVNTREGLQEALRRNELVWIKTTADFKPGKDVLWVMPNGETYATVLGNDHAVVVMGYSETGALIRDVLGPTSTNWNRTYEYEVPWTKFMAAWGQQQNDGISVAQP